MKTGKELTIPAKPTELCKVCGNYAWRWLDYPNPGKWVCGYCFRIDGLKEQMGLGCLDPELYEVLLALTKRGFYTCSSCAGHCEGARGGISFAMGQKIKGRNREDLLWILQKYGLKDIELETKGKYTTGVSFAAIPGSQYGNDLYDKHWEDFDFSFSVPPRPDKCPTCGSPDLWIQGEPYDDTDTLEWMCKACQPLPFNSDRALLSPEIAKRREALPTLKLWEVEDQKTGKAFLIRAKKEKNIYKRLGMSQDDVYFKFFIKRVK